MTKLMKSILFLAMTFGAIESHAMALTAGSLNNIDSLVIGNYVNNKAACEIFVSKGGSHLLLKYGNAPGKICTYASESDLFEPIDGGNGQYFVNVRPRYEGTGKKHYFVRIIGGGEAILFSTSALESQQGIGSVFALETL